jgi:hypothetical protein
LLLLKPWLQGWTMTGLILIIGYPSAAHVHILKRMLKKHFFNFVRTHVSQFRKQRTTSATPKELFERSVLHETRRIMHGFCFLVPHDTYWKDGDEPSGSTKQRSLDLLFKESSVSCSWSSLYCINTDLAIIIPRPADCMRLVKVIV